MLLKKSLGTLCQAGSVLKSFSQKNLNDKNTKKTYAIELKYLAEPWGSAEPRLRNTALMSNIAAMNFLQILLCVNQITWTGKIEEALAAKDPTKLEAIGEENLAYVAR